MLCRPGGRDRRVERRERHEQRRPARPAVRPAPNSPYAERRCARLGASSCIAECTSYDAPLAARVSRQVGRAEPHRHADAVADPHRAWSRGPAAPRRRAARGSSGRGSRRPRRGPDVLAGRRCSTPVTRSPVAGDRGGAVAEPHRAAGAAEPFGERARSARRCRRRRVPAAAVHAARSSRPGPRWRPRGSAVPTASPATTGPS